MTALEHLHAERSQLCTQKAELEQKINAINVRLSVTLPPADLRRLRGEKAAIVAQITTLNARLSDVNSRRQSAHAQQHTHDLQAASQITVQDDPPPAAESGPASTVHALVALREQYKQFAADATRSPTMRRMASQFVLDLGAIIKAAITKRPQ